MAVQVKTSEELSKEVQILTEKRAVLLSKIKESSEALGVEPTLEAVKDKIDEVSSSIKDIEAEISAALREIEDLEKEYSSEESSTGESDEKESEELGESKDDFD